MSNLERTMTSVSAIADFLGGKKTLGANPKTAGDWEGIILDGMSVCSAEALKESIAVPDTVLAQLIGISEKTLSRARAGRGRLDPVVSDRLFRVARIAALAIDGRLPTMFVTRAHVEAGGLMSYGGNLGANFRHAADYVDKILRGAKPADLPVEQPTKLELVINLKTAKAIGLTIPEAFLLRADEVIE